MPAKTKDKPPVQAFEDIEMDVSTLEPDGTNVYMVHIEAKAVWGHGESPALKGFPSMQTLAEAMAEGLARVLSQDSEVEFVVVKRVRGEFDSVWGQKKINRN